MARNHYKLLFSNFFTAYLVTFVPCVRADSDNLVQTVNNYFKRHSREATWTAKDYNVQSHENRPVYSYGLVFTPENKLKSFPRRLTTHDSKAPIPDSFDARTQWPNCATFQNIRAQGVCPSCWAVSAAAVLSDRLCIALGDSDPSYRNISISAQDALVCSGNVGYRVCSQGGQLETPYEMFASQGLVTGGEYRSGLGCMPYQAYTQQDTQTVTTSSCTKSCSNRVYAKTYRDDKRLGSKWYGMGIKFERYNGAAAIDKVIEEAQRELMTNGPVTIGIDAYADLESYSSGVYRHVTGDYKGGHAMKLIGWGTERGTDYWLIANSWGKQWGMDGVMKFLRGSNHCGVENYFITALPQNIAPPPTPTTPATTTTLGITDTSSAATNEMTTTTKRPVPTSTPRIPQTPPAQPPNFNPNRHPPCYRPLVAPVFNTRGTRIVACRHPWWRHCFMFIFGPYACSL